MENWRSLEVISLEKIAAEILPRKLFTATRQIYLEELPTENEEQYDDWLPVMTTQPSTLSRWSPRSSHENGNGHK
jgi:hypothetical protein